MIQHEGTENTKLHEGGRKNLTDSRSPPSKVRAKVISGQVIEAAIEVHRFLGPGLLESIYEECLAKELSLRKIPYQRQLALPVNYKGIKLEVSSRLDFLVADLVVVELKSVQNLDPIHSSQLLTYLRLSNRWLGLLLNFNTELLRHGLHRVLNG